MQLSITQLAPELTDAIIDHLYDDPSSLKAASLSCKRFLPCSRFHLFKEVDMKPQHFSTRPFPSNLSRLVQSLRLTADAEPKTAAFSWGYGMHVIPSPQPSISQLRDGISSFTPKRLELVGIKGSENSAMFAATATAHNLVDSVDSLSLTSCCIDTDDPSTLACSFPHLTSLRFSSLTFDNSRSVIRELERASPIRCWAYSPRSSDWSSVSESMVTDTELHLRDIEVVGTAWTEDLRKMMISLFGRLVNPSEDFTLRVGVSLPDLNNYGGLSVFGKFLKHCGPKIRRLVLYVEGSTTNETGFSNLLTGPSSQEPKLGWIFDLCPQLDVLELPGFLCRTQ